MDGRHSRSARTRAALLDAAIEIICTEGVAAATQRAVAARAGTSPASTTYHFSTADDLLVAAFELTFSRTLADFRRLEQEVVARRMTLLDAAMELVGRAPYGTHVPADGVIQLTLTAIHEPRLRPIADAFVEGFSALFRPLVQPPAAADTLVRALSGLILHEMARGAATPTATMRADMARLFAAFGIPVTDTDPARREEPE